MASSAKFVDDAILMRKIGFVVVLCGATFCTPGANFLCSGQYMGIGFLM